jgi:polysaccharide biosynthesis protein PslG
MASRPCERSRGSQVVEPHGRRGWAARLAIAALLAVGAIGLWAGSAQAVPKTFFGVVPQTSLGTADYDRMGQGKVGLLRMQLNWSASDPTPAPDDYDFRAFDPIVANAARNKIRILPFVYGTPSWVANGLDGFNCSGASCATFAPKSGAARAAWADFVSAAVARYGPNGTFWKENPTLPQKPIKAWQIWNEQNSPSFYAPKPNAKAYVKLLKSSKKAIRPQDRSADIVLGGMAELAGVKSAIKGSKYLRKLYKVKGAKKNFDGVAPHPYGARVKKVSQQIDLIRKELRKGGDPKAELWVTELGWSSEKGGNPLNRGPKGQATRLKQAFKYFKKNRRKLHVETVNWFSWMDSPTSICKWCADSGLFKAGLVEKPAWRAFTKFTGGS